MPDKDSLAGYSCTLLDRIQKPLLVDHFNDGLEAHARVVPAIGQSLGKGPVCKLEVRKVDVGVFLYGSQEGPGLVTGKIVDNREIVSLSAQKGDQLKGVGKKMVRGDKIEVVDTISLNHRYNSLKQLMDPHDFSEIVAGDLVVLTE